MNSKKILFILILILNIFIFIIPARGYTETSVLAIKDSYIDTDHPLSNFGGENHLIAGYYWSSLTETYIAFDTSSKPFNWIKAEMVIDFYSISETTQLTISLITENWNELTITWIDKPNHGPVITPITVAIEQEYKIDISNYVQGNSVSICINATTLPTGYIRARSREGDWSYGPGPKLVWTHEVEKPSLMVFIPIIAVVGVIIGIVIIALIYDQYQKNKKIAAAKIREPIKIPIAEIRFCSECGADVSGKFCNNCGAELK